jgi:hypothetical protein
MQAANRVRKASVSAATRVFEYDPQPSMWAASGAAIAHAPDLTELREPDTGGANIQFDAHGHSKRDAGPEELQRRNTERRTSFGPTASLSPTKQLSDPLQHTVTEPTIPAKEPWSKAIFHGLTAFWKFFLTPTGFCITIYGLNVVGWGAMLFFLILKAAPAMNHPDGGDADSSPRKIWLEIDSQVLNALFCLTAWGLAPWRFRDLYWVARWRFGNHDASRRAIRRLAARNEAWFRLREEDCEAKETFHDARAPPTTSWKLDFVVWMMVMNTLLQVGMAFFMWHWNRIDRPSWGTGTFIGLGCGVSLLAGLVTWWEGRKVKKIEGPKIEARTDSQTSEAV